MKQCIRACLNVINVINGIFFIIDSIFQSNNFEFHIFLIKFSIGVFIISTALNYESIIDKMKKNGD